MQILSMVVGPPNSWKTSWIKSNLLFRNKDSVIINTSKTTIQQSFIDAINQHKNIIIDGENDSLKIREKYLKYAKQNKYKTICYLFNNAIQANKQFKLNFDEPQKDEFSEVVIVPKISKVLDLSNCTDRIIVVGDIHGCFDELKELLTNLKFNYEKDFLISAGDLCDRGPKSLNVLRFFVSCPHTLMVEGNHDSKLKRYLKGNKVVVNQGLEKTVSELDSLKTTSIVDYQTLIIKTLSYIESSPQIIKLPNFKGKEQYLVHAGINASKGIYAQSYNDSLYLRNIGGDGYFDPSGDVWYNRLSGNYRVICGHIIHENPRPTPNVICLDGGCVTGGTLRAMVDGDKIFEIRARKTYYEK